MEHWRSSLIDDEVIQSYSGNPAHNDIMPAVVYVIMMQVCSAVLTFCNVHAAYCYSTSTLVRLAAQAKRPM